MAKPSQMPQHANIPSAPTLTIICRPPYWLGINGALLPTCFHVAVKLNGNRNVTGVLRGFDQFMNIVLDNTVEEVSSEDRNDIGLVVSASSV